MWPPVARTLVSVACAVVAIACGAPAGGTDAGRCPVAAAPMGPCSEIAPGTLAGSSCSGCWACSGPVDVCGRAPLFVCADGRVTAEGPVPCVPDAGLD